MNKMEAYRYKACYNECEMIARRMREQASLPKTGQEPLWFLFLKEAEDQMKQWEMFKDSGDVRDLFEYNKNCMLVALYRNLTNTGLLVVDHSAIYQATAKEFDDFKVVFL